MKFLVEHFSHEGQFLAKKASNNIIMVEDGEATPVEVIDQIGEGEVILSEE